MNRFFLREKKRINASVRPIENGETSSKISLEYGFLKEELSDKRVENPGSWQKEPHDRPVVCGVK